LTIWLIGGTGDSSTIVKAIAKITSELIITVTTPEAKQLYDSPNSVVVGKMDRLAMESFCYRYHVKAIVDATHPFAFTVSQNAIAISQSLNIPYLRYERAVLNCLENSLIKQLDSFTTLLTGDYLLNQRVLLTVGCNVLPLFKSWHDRSTLFTRILPKLDSLQIALDSGFKSDRIIALRPPITEALELALWQQWQISLVVTKASGISGGEDIKVKVAQKLGIPLITIIRPQITYPQQTCALEEIILFCCRYQ
jgi:precorrin-6A/cobalt-precorrin-6A reductase